MESVKIFDEFKLNEISDDWIKCIWDADFVFFERPPAEDLMFLESQDMRLLLHETSTIIKTWLIDVQDSNSNTIPISWNTLILSGVKVQALLVVLGYIIKSGQSQYADEEYREACLGATSLYFILLAIPESTAFNVFHPNLYERAIDTFKLSDYLLHSAKKQNGLSNSQHSNYTEDSMVLNNSLTQEEAFSLHTNLNAGVCDLIIMLKTFRFKRHEQSLDTTIQGLLKLIRTENDNTKMSTLSFTKHGNQVALPQNAFFALNKLCDENHGPTNKTLMLIVSYTLPYLLYNQAQNQKKYACVMQRNAICFLQHILCAHRKAAEDAFLVLAQQLMIECPERSEPRQKQALVIIQLLSICKEKILMEVCMYLLYMSHDSKIQNRIFTQEIIRKILVETHLHGCPELANGLKARIHETLVAIVLSRCVDCSSIVRGKALAILAEYTDMNKCADTKIIFQMLQPNKPLPTIEELKASLLTSKNVLPGMITFTSLLIHRAEDKAVAVRKNALTIFGNLARTSPAILEKAIPIISLHCRDPALTVRGLAVQLLSQLLQEFPDNSVLLNKWVETVVPQIFDIDPKVQQKVLQCFQELLLNRIENFSICKEDKMYSLPWRILNTLTRSKMTKDLSKACSFWTKNGTITKSIVEKIQSHIGSVNNTSAWILLSALADTMTIPNIEKYISNYRELLQTSDFHANLILQMLKKCWMSLHEDTLKELRIYLLEQLEQFQIYFRFIGTCMDIINELTKYLYPTTGKALIEERTISLIKTSEDAISKMLNFKTSTLQTFPNSLKAMFTLGHATFFCNWKISPLVLQILQGILLSTDVEDLQMYAVAILGQQAVRDRDVAQKVVPIFGKLLRQEMVTSLQRNAALKINSAKALADICMRFTGLVDPYLSDLCISMKDPNPQIRSTIIIIFIQLLLEDFIKMKGPFFFHVLTMLCDNNNAIRDLTIFLIEERFLVKNKTLISQRFVECIYYYNDYQFGQNMGKKGSAALTLPGRGNQDKRSTIYDFMLEHLDPLGKLKLLIKLTSQILCGVCKSMLDIKKEEGACVLKDALYIISNERLQPSTLTKDADESQEEDELAVQISTSTMSGIKLFADGFKRHGLEVLLPTLVRLKHRMSALKSSLDDDIERLLVKTYLSYNKDQLTRILNEYPKLEKDIERYRRRMEDQKQLNEKDMKESKHIDDSPTQKCNRTPRVILHRLTPAQLLKWTDSPIISSAMFPQNDIRDTSDVSDVNHVNVYPGLNTSTPKSHKCSLSIPNCTDSLKRKHRRSFSLCGIAPKRRIIEVESFGSNN